MVGSRVKKQNCYLSIFKITYSFPRKLGKKNTFKIFLWKPSKSFLGFPGNKANTKNDKIVL